MLDSEVLALGFVVPEVFDPVVEAIVVDVVDDLGTVERALHVVLHHDPVLHLPSSLWRVSMVRAVDLAVFDPADINDPNCPDLWLLSGTDTLPILDTDRVKTGAANSLPNAVRPALDLGSTTGTGSFHSFTSCCSIARNGRSRHKKREWLTLNRVPAWMPSVQEGLFG